MRLVLITVALLLAGCTDRGQCLESHAEQSTVLMLVGKVFVHMPQTVIVCDRWEYPDGRPSN